MWSWMNGIFHFTVLVAAGEIDRAFSSKILDSWECSLVASASALAGLGVPLGLGTVLVVGTVSGFDERMFGVISGPAGSVVSLGQGLEFALGVPPFWSSSGL